MSRSSHITEAQAREWAELTFSGVCQPKAAERIGVSSAQTMRRACSRFGVEYRARGVYIRFSDKHKRTAARIFNDARAKGETVCSAEHQAGHTASAVYQWMLEFGIKQKRPAGKLKSWEVRELLMLGTVGGYNRGGRWR